MHVLKVNFKSSLDTSLAKTKQNKTKQTKNQQICKFCKKPMLTIKVKGHSVYNVGSTDSHRSHNRSQRRQSTGTRKHRELSIMSKTLAMEMKRMSEIKKEPKKKKTGMKGLSETPSPSFPPSHFQGTSPTGRLDLGLISPIL